MNRSLNQVVDEIRVWAAAHVQVNEMAYGSIVDIYNRNEITHCIVAVNCNNASVETNWVDLTLEVAVFDLVDAPSVDYGKRPQHEVESDTLQIINDLRKTIEYADRWKDWSELIAASGAQKFVEHTSDAVTGWMMTMNVRVYSQPGVCDLPLIAYDYGGDYSAVCAPVRIFENGVLVDTVASGGTYSYTPSCDDADWTLKDTSGDTLNSGSIASGGSEDITAPDANYSLDNTDGTELSTGVIESGGSETIVAPDAQVFTNNTAGSLPGVTNVPSGAFTNITYPNARVNVVDQNGNNLASQNVPSGVITDVGVTIPDAGIIASPLLNLGEVGMPSALSDGLLNPSMFKMYGDFWDDMRTKYSGSFVGWTGDWRLRGLTGGYYDEDTGDFKEADGTITNKATAFPDDIVVDWSTYNQRTDEVFCIYLTPFSPDTLANQRTAAETSTYLTHTNWSLITEQIFDRIKNQSPGAIFFDWWGYEPFDNFGLGNDFVWACEEVDATRGKRIGIRDGNFDDRLKTETYYAIMGRFQDITTEY